MTGVIGIKGPGDGVGTLPGLQGVGHGLQCKAEGQANADKRLTIFNTYAHPTDQPIAHLQGQHPMTASEPPAKRSAESRGDDVVCRVQEGRAATTTTTTTTTTNNNNKRPLTPKSMPPAGDEHAKLRT